VLLLISPSPHASFTAIPGGRGLVSDPADLRHAGIADYVVLGAAFARPLPAEHEGVPRGLRASLGDVIIDEDDVYGDGVNIAARLEELANPGGVVISSAVFEQVRDRVPDSFEDLGDRQVKNIARPVRVYRLAQLSTPVSPTAMSPLPLPDKPSIAVLPWPI
jgi:adenylate cyclase